MALIINFKLDGEIKKTRIEVSCTEQQMRDVAQMAIDGYMDAKKLKGNPILLNYRNE